MKKASVIFIALAGAALLTGCNNQQTPPASGSTNSASPTANATTAGTAETATTADAASSNTNILSTDRDRESYAYGMGFGQNLKDNGVDLDLDVFLRGMKDAQSGGSTLLTKEQMMAAIGELRKSVMMQQQKKHAEQSQMNQVEGEAFLAHNKTLPGVTTLSNGMQYKVITDGTGATPSPNDMVTVNYSGSDIHGKVFDSSASHGRPFECNVSGGIIRGWTEALERMKVGSKWEIYVPSDMAYGPMGRPPVIQPNETLVFQIELLGVKARPAPPQVQPLTSDIIEVPSADQIKKGAKIQTIKASDAQKMQEAATNNAPTNQAQ